MDKQKYIDAWNNLDEETRNKIRDLGNQYAYDNPAKMDKSLTEIYEFFVESILDIIIDE